MERSQDKWEAWSVSYEWSGFKHQTMSGRRAGVDIRPGQHTHSHKQDKQRERETHGGTGNTGKGNTQGHTKKLSGTITLILKVVVEWSVKTEQIIYFFLMKIHFCVLMIITEINIVLNNNSIMTAESLFPWNLKIFFSLFILNKGTILQFLLYGTVDTKMILLI